MKRVVIVGIAPAQELDVIGPLSVFSMANDVARSRGAAPPYRVEVVSGGTSRTIAGQSGVGLTVAKRYRDVRGPIDTLLVAGGSGARGKLSPSLLAWIRARAKHVRRLGSVCTGTFVLAEAGLLGGRRVATHWAWADELARRYPGVAVDAAPIWVRDGGVYTSAGICAGIDLALGLVESDRGSDVALRVARHLVVYLRRPGDQAQFSTALAGQTSEKRAFRDLAVWIAEHVRDDLRVPALAERANMSERNFCRAFVREVGISPGKYVERVRYERARERLETSEESVGEVADACGYGSAEVMRRTFLRQAGITPKHYRERFHA